MEKEFAEIVNGIGDEGCNAQVVGAGSGFIYCEGFEIYASEVE